MPSTIATASKTAEVNASGTIGWGSRASWATASGIYTCALDTGTARLDVIKTTGDGTTHTTVDGNGGPIVNGSTAPYSTWFHTDGYAYVLYNRTSNTLSIRRFDTATDTWEASDFVSDPTTTLNTSRTAVRIVVRSDGDIVVCWQSSTSSQVRYRRWDGSSWNSETVLQAVTSRIKDAILMASDVILFYYYDGTNGDASWKTLTSADVLSSESDLDAAVNTANLKTANMVTYNDGTNNKIGSLSRDTGGEIDYYHATQGTGPSFTTVNAALSGVAMGVTSVAAAEFGGHIYVVASAANGIRYDLTTSLTTLTFGTDQTLLTGLATVDVAPQWMKGGGGLGVQYHESGDLKVEWITAPSFGSSADVPLATNEISGFTPTVTVVADADIAAIPVVAQLPTAVTIVDSPLGLIPVITFTPTLLSAHDVAVASTPITGLLPTALTSVDISLVSVPVVTFDAFATISVDVPFASIPFSGLMPTAFVAADVPLGATVLTGLLPDAITVAVSPLGTIPFVTHTPSLLSVHDVPLASIPVTTFVPTIVSGDEAPLAIISMQSLTPEVVVGIDSPLASSLLVSFVPTVSVFADVSLGSVFIDVFTPDTIPADDASSADVPLGELVVVGLTPTLLSAHLVPTMLVLPVIGLEPTIVAAGEIPLGTIALFGHSPTPLVSIDVPIASVGIQSHTPTIGIAVELPIAPIPLQSFVPETTPPDPLSGVDIPLGQIQLFVFAPTVVVTVDIEVGTLVVFGLTPTTIVSSDVPFATVGFIALVPVVIDATDQMLSASVSILTTLGAKTRVAIQGTLDGQETLSPSLYAGVSINVND